MKYDNNNLIFKSDGKDVEEWEYDNDNKMLSYNINGEKPDYSDGKITFKCKEYPRNGCQRIQINFEIS